MPRGPSGQLRGVPHQDCEHGASGGGQPASDHEAVAAVVPGSAQHHDERRPDQRAPRAANQLGQAPELGLRNLAHRRTRGLHQCVLRQAQLVGSLVDARHLIGADEDGNAALGARGRIGHGRARGS